MGCIPLHMPHSSPLHCLSSGTPQTRQGLHRHLLQGDHLLRGDVLFSLRQTLRPCLSCRMTDLGLHCNPTALVVIQQIQV